MKQISFAFSLLSVCFSASKTVRYLKDTLKPFEGSKSRYSDFGTEQDNLSKDLKLVSRTLDAFQCLPRPRVGDEQSGGRSSTLVTVPLCIFSPSSVSLKTHIGGILTTTSSLYCMDQSSSIKRVEALYERSRRLGEIDSLREILDAGLKKLLRMAKRLFSDIYDSLSSLGGYEMRFEQQLQLGEKVFGRSLLEGPQPRSLDGLFPCSSTWNPAEIAGNPCILCGMAEGIPDLGLTKLRLTEKGLDERTTAAQSQFGCLRDSHGLCIGGHSRSDTDSLSDGEIKAWLEHWQQLDSHTRTQPGIVPLLDRFVTLSPEPSKSQLYHHQQILQRGNGIFPNAREPKIMKTSDTFIGDEGFGPNFGKSNMGRDDDDEDNCVGFCRFSCLAKRGSTLFHGGERDGRACGNDILAADQRGTIPRFGPPKRDPVAAVMGGNVKRFADETTLRVWRDAITRTCGGITGRVPTEAKKWEEIGWKSAWEMHGNARGEGASVCAY